MGKTNLEVNSAFLATKEKLPDRLLFTGKIARGNDREGYLFYLFEILSPWSKVSKIKKLVVDTLERSILSNDFSEESFEQILSHINNGLNRLSEAGENEWIGNLNGVLGLVYNDKLLIAQSGKISGYIFRKGKISSLTESPALVQPNPLQTFSDIIAGDLIKNDRVVFGNSELYNQLSLDKIRRITEKLSPKESNLELYKELRRFKINNINAIVIEVKNISDAENSLLSDIPEIIYLDQVKDNLIKIARKRLDPILKNTCIHGKKCYEATRAVAGKHGKVLFEKTKIYSGKFGKKIAENYKTIKDEKVSHSQIGKLTSDENYKNLKIKTKTYTRKTKSSISNFFEAAIPVLSNIYRFIRLKDNKKYLYLSLIIILIFSGYMKIRANNIHRDEIRQERAIVNSYDQATELFNKAKENLALGKVQDTKELEEALSLSLKAEQSPDNKEKALILSKEIHESIDSINKITRLYDQKPILKLGEGISKFVITGYDIYGINDEGKIYYGNTQDKQAKLFSSIGKDNGTVKDAALDENAGRILFMTSNNNLIGLDIASKTSSEVKITDESAWESTPAIEIFTSNIYLIDTSKDSIAKHVKDGDGYAKSTTYVDAKKGGLKGPIDIAIDGNIFVLNGDGKMIKFTRGTIDSSFSLSGIPGTEETSLKIIFTNANTNYIYVLDSSGNKIIRFDKNGQFVKQYAIDGVEINDFSINDKVKKGYVLSQGNVYEFDL